jgi:hypothetical protein
LTFKVVITLKVLASAGAVLGDVVEMLNGGTVVALLFGILAVVLGNVTKETVVIRERVLGLPKVVATVCCRWILFVKLSLTVCETREVEIDGDKTS